jgi:hypothetical protein
MFILFVLFFFGFGWFWVVLGGIIVIVIVIVVVVVVVAVVVVFVVVVVVVLVAVAFQDVPVEPKRGDLNNSNLYYPSTRPGWFGTGAVHLEFHATASPPPLIYVNKWFWTPYHI